MVEEDGQGIPVKGSTASRRVSTSTPIVSRRPWTVRWAAARISAFSFEKVLDRIEVRAAERQVEQAEERDFAERRLGLTLLIGSLQRLRRSRPLLAVAKCRH
ncbi:hypothetical protein [Bradyrhizobium ivorense]|uniref:hypothetical protein n=1 Tax=Bradyrhizobium ivorense TaxID=2511166 RepID=UPI0024BF3835|nr:hypothetical protein [Bradyrhizobium ivorense]